MKCPALFLDRDGVINVDHGYVSKQTDFVFIDGIFDLCRTARSRGYRLFVITNQSGIGRGYYTKQDFWSLTAWMLDVFNGAGVGFDRIYYCPFHPQAELPEFRRDSPFRKPRPGMILRAASEFEVDISKSVLIGDKESDIRAGVAAGIRYNLLFSADTVRGPGVSMATAVIGSHVEAAFFLQGP